MVPPPVHPNFPVHIYIYRCLTVTTPLLFNITNRKIMQAGGRAGGPIIHTCVSSACMHNGRSGPRRLLGKISIRNIGKNVIFRPFWHF